MKTKKLLQTSFLVIALCVINQFAKAQSQSENVKLNEQPAQTNATPVSGCKCLPGGNFSCKYCNTWGKLACYNYCRNHHTSIADNGSSTIDETSFIDIYPNPVSASATISFFLEQTEKIAINIYDLNGRLIKTIADWEMAEGEHQMEWSAEKISAGIYLLQFQSAEFSKMEKLVVTK